VLAWQPGAADVAARPGHHMAEEAPAPLADALATFLAARHARQRSRTPALDLLAATRRG